MLKDLKKNFEQYTDDVIFRRDLILVLASINDNLASLTHLTALNGINQFTSEGFGYGRDDYIKDYQELLNSGVDANYLSLIYDYSLSVLAAEEGELEAQTDTPEVN